MFRVCTQCKINKMIDCFAADNRNMTDGRRAICKDCVRISERKRRSNFSTEMKDKIADRQRKYIDENTQIVCSMYNAGKGHHNELDFIAMCMAVAENNKYNLAAIERLKELRSL